MCVVYGKGLFQIKYSFETHSEIIPVQLGSMVYVWAFFMFATIIEAQKCNSAEGM